ncbi:CIC11C00000000665 [Sungouiella intermedia]|uniref:CIC11C00000000665 n=1 Tax=Sungouiella intermedia TaxID=45354 RepID=A0A1L0G1E7_9ASCO|nr:CIC11C00000000665 [[Candida] intermedia]
MTSLAVLPALKKTITDLMDEDLYQLPAQSPSHTSVDMRMDSSPNMNVNAATATLSNLLNVPESFVEHYSRVNGSNPAINNIPSLFLDNSTDYTSYSVDSSANKVNPFNTYANPDSLSGDQHSLQPPQLQNLLVQMPPGFVQPELVLMRPLPASTRTRRITTLDEHDAGAKQVKDEDYYLFNTDIQPSQLMANRNFFNTEDYLDSSLFIMNGDLDAPEKTSGFDSRPVPGFEGDYLSLGEFAEDAEEFDDLSDDDNYFQDDNDDDFNDFHMTDSAFGNQLATSDSFIPLGKVPSEGFMEVMPLDNSAESLDEMMVEDEPEHFEAVAPAQSFTTPMMHIPEEYHQTAAEITANNPNHQCELVNPSTGRPCNKQFSRPYDLIRHQETIHASKKKIFRCVICEGRVNGGPGNGKLKTFSRGDALSRHIKVKHGLGGQEAVDLINEAKENVEFVLV